METIILILLALRLLGSPTEFTEEYKRTHSAEIQKATEIYNNNDYEVSEGGVVIEDDGNPRE
jgi:hypothetical protein